MKTTDKIEPKHMYLMGVEELMINVVLLCYFYGMNGSMMEGDEQERRGMLKTIISD